jgi:hypothetical protein
MFGDVLIKRNAPPLFRQIVPILSGAKAMALKSFIETIEARSGIQRAAQLYTL